MHEINYVKNAVTNIGGPTRAANLTNVSTNTIHKWIAKKSIPRLEKAEIISKLSGYNLKLLWTKFIPETYKPNHD